MLGIFENRKRGGFTIIELLVVLAIVSIVSATVLASVNTGRLKARDIKRTADVRGVINALALWHDTNGNFPCIGSYTVSTNPNFAQFLVDAGYLQTNPSDPLNNASYRYELGTFKRTVGGACGQIAYLGIYAESGATCPTGGMRDGSQHCHIFFPEPLPCPNNPYYLSNLDGSCPTSLKD